METRPNWVNQCSLNAKLPMQGLKLGIISKSFHIQGSPVLGGI